MKAATAKINNKWLYTLVGQRVYTQMVDAGQIEHGEAVQIKLEFEFETVPVEIRTRVEINGEKVAVTYD